MRDRHYTNDAPEPHHETYQPRNTDCALHVANEIMQCWQRLLDQKPIDRDAVNNGRASTLSSDEIRQIIAKALMGIGHRFVWLTGAPVDDQDDTDRLVITVECTDEETFPPIEIVIPRTFLKQGNLPEQPTVLRQMIDVIAAMLRRVLQTITGA